MAQRALPLAAAALVVFPAFATADLRITESVTGTAGGKPFSSTRTTYIAGPRMRIENALTAETVTTIFDLPVGVTIGLNAGKRQAELRPIAARAAELQKDYPRERVSVTLTPGTSVQTIAGQTCADHTFTIRVPMTKDGSIAMVADGTACLAADAPGADDFAAFAKSAIDAQLVLGYASDNYILLAATRGQTELYRALAGRGGIPYRLTMNTSVEGKGMLASLVRKGLTGTRTTTVTATAVAPLAETLFTVPAGWKTRRP